jgi:hypothetical protein
MHDVPLSQHEILDLDECASIRDQVIAARAFWTPRSIGGSFFTLGAASYLDAPNRHAQYLAAAASSNPILGRSFGWLNERIRSFFDQLFDEKTFFDSRYAVPGFHIFVLNGHEQNRDALAGRAHFDLQWRDAMPGLASPETISFTMLVEEPTGGASMAVWPARYEHALRVRMRAVDYASNHAPQTIDYARGRIVVHDGYILHAIGLSRASAPTGLRITLQGHGIRVTDGWLLYW